MGDPAQWEGIGQGMGYFGNAFTGVGNAFSAPQYRQPMPFDPNALYRQRFMQAQLDKEAREAARENAQDAAWQGFTTPQQLPPDFVGPPMPSPASRLGVSDDMMGLFKSSGKGPELMAAIMAEQAKRSQYVPITPDLAARFGLPSDTAGVIDLKTGEPKILKQSDVKSPDALRQALEIAQAGRPQNVGSIPPGYQLRQDGNTMSMVPIPGSPADAEAKRAADSATAGKASQARTADIVVQDIDRALTLVDKSTLPTTGGVGSLLARVPGTSSHDLSKIVDTLRANIGFDKLQEMKKASPTGGALGSVSESENKMLQSVLGSLEQSQSKEQFQYNLKRLNNLYLDTIHGPGNGPERHQLEPASAGKIRMMNLDQLKKLVPDDLTDDQRKAAFKRWNELSTGKQ